MTTAKAELGRAAIRAVWPTEFDDGARCGLTLFFPGNREVGGYPAGFHEWNLDRRNAWYAGNNVGRIERRRRQKQRSPREAAGVG